MANTSKTAARPLSAAEKYELAVKNVERFSRKLPNLSPGAEELRVNMLRRAKAELTLRKKALEHERRNPPPNDNDLALSRLLNMPAPPLHR
jgi:hypothetical protein